MKMKKGLLTMLALLSIGSSAFAQTEPIVGTGKVNVPIVVRSNGAGGVKDVKEVSVVKNRQAYVKIELLEMPTEAEAAYRDLQFDLTLPAGITVTTAGGVVKDAAAQHTVAFNTLTVDETNSKVRFVVYNDGGEDKTIEKFTNGIIVEIPVSVSNGFTGTQPATLTNVLTSNDAAETSIALVDGPFSFRAVLLGDVNDDGEVKNSDQVAIVMHLLDEPSTPFVFEAADMEYDAENPNFISNADAISLADKLLEESSSAKEFIEEVVSDVETEIEPD